MVCLGNPEGRVSFDSLVTRGFRLSGRNYSNGSLRNTFPLKHGKKVSSRDRTLT
jgi:hypothetical protein